jgi:hypothetical protein
LAGYLAPELNLSLLRSGDADDIGYVTIGNTSQVALGALVTLREGTNVAQYQVADVQPGLVGLRAVYPGTPSLNSLNYGLTSLAQFSSSAKLIQNAQLVYGQRPQTGAVLSILAPSPTKGQVAAGVLYSAQGIQVPVSRSSTGACGTWSDGLTFLGNNTPRVENLGLLVEVASTNLFVDSQFQAGGWTGSSSGVAPTVTQNAAVAPDGTTTAAMVTYNTAVPPGGWSYITQQNFSPPGNGVYTISVWLKAGTLTSVGLYMVDNGGIPRVVQAALTNQWQRFVLTGTSTATLTNIGLDIGAGDGTTTVGAGTLYVWGAQMEKSPFASSLIKSTVSTASRSADFAHVSNCPLPTNGAVDFLYTPQDGTTLSSSGGSNYCLLATRGAGFVAPGFNLSLGSFGIPVVYSDDGSGQVPISFNAAGNLTWTSSVTYRLRLEWRGTTMSMWRNGVSLGSGTTKSPAGHKDVWLLTREDSFGPLGGHGWISDLKVTSL